MSNFSLIGAAGYIAPRHMKAIKETGNSLIAAMDPNDSVGIIDTYFPDADYFTEFERFERHIEKLRRIKSEKMVEFVSICSPNFLHDSHIRFALRSGANAICEKPIVLNPWNIDALKEVENDSGKKIYTVLQLRLHPAILTLKKKIDESDSNRVFDIDLTYITSRGKWYDYSWKGDENKSGGVSTNIGVHFFDMLYYIFGNVKENIVHYKDNKTASGYLEFQRARVRWFLSVNSEYLPLENKLNSQKTFRSITIDSDEIEFSDGFTDLHTKIYEDILHGNGFGLEENLVAIQTVHDIRISKPIGLKGNFHPYIKALK
jgi:UDP-N-acetyl-2-amino-2-deoxyglucuronate dehydrogenase